MIRLATAQDIDRVGTLFDEILDQEQSVAYTNWQRGKYPTADHARRAQEAGTLFVAEEGGALYGCVILNGEQLPEYGDIAWTIPAQPAQVMVIHTLCISPRWSGRGRARELVAFCEEEARRQGRRVMRLDTYEGNVPANALYPKLGYRYAGLTRFHFQNFIWENLNCYEKLL